MKPGMHVRRLAERLAVCCLAALSLLAAASQPAHAQPGVDRQESGDAIRAERAISLTPHITELIFAAGAGDKIVGTVIGSDYPEAALDIPIIGDGLNIKVEKALAVRPDVVIAWQASGAATTLAPMLTRLHIPLIYSAPRRLQDIPAEIIRFGKLFDTSRIADPAASALARRLRELEQRYAQRAPVSLFIEIGTAPLYTIGNDPLLNDVLRICGGVNIYGSTAIAAPQVSAESVLVLQPDAIIAPAIDDQRLAEARQRWSALRLPAARQGHIYGIDPDKLFRPGPRLIEAAESLCQYLDKVRKG
jgi:iron complex transport system substrate-binding protein/vitamin B12 transport system substrate-binding protein